MKTGKVWSDVGYPTLLVSSSPQRFIESGSIPSDGRQVDTTWQYVNVKGGPDRRFNNNRQLPVMLYGRLEIVSSTGLRWLIDCSRTETAEWVRKIFAAHV